MNVPTVHQFSELDDSRIGFFFLEMEDTIQQLLKRILNAPGRLFFSLFFFSSSSSSSSSFFLSLFLHNSFLFSFLPLLSFVPEGKQSRKFSRWQCQVIGRTHQLVFKSAVNKFIHRTPVSRLVNPVGLRTLSTLPRGMDT